VAQAVTPRHYCLGPDRVCPGPLINHARSGRWGHQDSSKPGGQIVRVNSVESVESMHEDPVSGRHVNLDDDKRRHVVPRVAERDNSRERLRLNLVSK